MSLVAPASDLRQIFASHPGGRENLIPILQEVQEHHGYLSEDAIRGLAATIGISENEIYGVATFYTQFRFRPPPSTPSTSARAPRATSAAAIS